MSAYYQQYGHMPDASGPTGAGGYRGYGDAGGFNGGNYQYRTVNEEELRDIFGDQSGFSDFFETLFGSSMAGGTGRTQTAGRGQQRATKGQDIESAIDVTLEEAYKGTTRILELTEADGTSRRLEVKIPVGVNDGSRIRIAGQGMQGSAGRGDLYLIVHIVSDPRFTREGTDVRTRVDVPLAIAILGGETQVPTPDGRKLLLRIPAETPNGKAFRLRGQGMPQTGKPDSRGDLYAEVNIVLPKNLTEEQRQLFEAFARSTGYEK
ncbi:MAG TPA: DnaJ C-terminal domain-containing protein [Ktedonobacteraceae bacterium]|nr:DnaJ C-terminal domain-containing protein [Ktedonobacteraceae bacterium]